MRGLGGFVLLAGIGVGLFVYFPAPVDSETNLQQAARALAIRDAADEIGSAPREATPAPLKSRLAYFSPERPLVAASRSFAAKAPAAKAGAVAHWPAQVIPAAAESSGALDPSDPNARHRLIVDIQQNLKRAGCYWGRANGAWTASTREAMQNFTERANAALPVDKPDYLLLNLLKAYNGQACGAAGSVTAGQPTNGNGAAVATAQPEVLPWKAANTQQAVRLYTPLPHSTVTTSPLPGRMAIGGPTDFPLDTQAPLIPGSGNGRVATAEPDQGPAPHAPSHSSAPKPSRQAKKSSGSWRKPAKGTPRYNLMLSLGGVY